MKETKAKINVGELIINIILAIILVVIFVLSMNIILSAKKGYVEIFGKSNIAVLTNSMAGENKDSFNKGDMITIKILDNYEEKANLQVGDIITYYDTIEGKLALNSHRIVEVCQAGTEHVYYMTKGDNNPYIDTQEIPAIKVIGVYVGKITGLGNVTIFLRSSVGFGICVLLPSILIVIYCAFLVVRNVQEKNGTSKKAQLIEEEKERIRAELMAEMQKEKENQDNNNNN